MELSIITESQSPRTIITGQQVGLMVSSWEGWAWRKVSGPAAACNAVAFSTFSNFSVSILADVCTLSACGIPICGTVQALRPAISCWKVKRRTAPLQSEANFPEDRELSLHLSLTDWASRPAGESKSQVRLGGVPVQHGFQKAAQVTPFWCLTSSSEVGELVLGGVDFCLGLVGDWPIDNGLIGLGVGGRV